MIFPEFNKIVGRKETTARNTVGLIQEICEEGVPNIELPYFVRSFNPPAKANVLIGLTPSFLKAHIIDWWGMGFAQRFIPVSWSYSNQQIHDILQYIEKQLHLKEKIYSNDFEEKEIAISERKAKKLENYALRICEDMTDYVERLCIDRRLLFNRRTEKELPFRFQERLQRFLKAIALLNGRDRVHNRDIYEFKKLFEFMNLRFEDLRV